MSLHLGNLSSRILRDDLELVFRRFGRCTIQVKDRYGFVVFDYPASAEKALKALQGKRICGEAITLSWSNRQPLALQRFSRGGNSYDPQSRRHSVKENVISRLSSNNQKDHKINYKQEDGQGRKRGSSDLVDDPTGYPDNSKGCVGEGNHTSSNDRIEVGVGNLEDDGWMDGWSRLWMHQLKIVLKMTWNLTGTNLIKAMTKWSRRTTNKYLHWAVQTLRGSLKRE